MKAQKSMVPVERRGPLARVMGTPFSLLDELRDELDRFWEGARLPRVEAETTMTWWPKLDIYEKKNQLVVKADLPGMTKSDVEVAIEGGDLILRGERQEETQVEEENVYRAERSWGKFLRRVPLTFEVDPSNVQATFKEGVLEVTMPLPKEEKKPKAQKITVN
ncbi:MAG: Hsp20/alpha crystallin family protein [Acidobacteriota bacterium]